MINNCQLEVGLMNGIMRNNYSLYCYIFIMQFIITRSTTACYDDKIEQRSMIGRQIDIVTKLGEKIEIELAKLSEKAVRILTDPLGRDRVLGLQGSMKLDPVGRQHHGNWVYSVRAYNECTIERYQVYSINIEESVDTSPKAVTKVKRGDDLHLSLNEPLNNLETCELIKPKTTTDRLYMRDFSIIDNKCGYIVPNITELDGGIWQIIAMSDIVNIGRLKVFVI